METRNTTSGGTDSLGYDRKIDLKVLFEGRPSVLAIIGTLIRAVLLLAIAGFLVFYRIEKLIPLAEKLIPGEKIPWDVVHKISDYSVIGGCALAVLVLLHILKRVIQLKLTSYLVTTDRIEWERGLIRRKIDNIDLFRVRDIQLYRSLFELILGIGTIKLFTSDKSDPEFYLKSIRNPRRVYEMLKKASLDADRRRGVVHIE